MAEAASSEANVHAVLVARGGKLVFERYWDRRDQQPPGRKVTFAADTLHNVKSASKSVASLAPGSRSIAG
jgi:hypothetical protein